MHRRLIDYIAALSFKRLFLYGVCATLALLLFLVVLTALLPALLSTPPMQSLLRLGLSKALKQPVSWSRLDLSWRGGVTLTGLAVGDRDHEGDGEAPLLSASVGELRLVPGLDRDETGRLRVDLALRVRKAEARLAPGPAKPKEEPAGDPLTRVADAVQRFQGMDWALPVDLRLFVDAAPLAMSYLDPASRRELRLSDVAFRLEAPSLAAAPVETSLTGVVAPAGAKPQPFRFAAKVSDLVAAGRRVKPASALFSARASAPGLSLDLSGGVTRRDGLKGAVRLDLPGLLPVAAGFAGRELPQLSGKMALDLRAKADGKGDLALALDLGGEKVALERIRGRTAGLAPLDFKLHQGLVSDHKRQQVFFTGGRLASPGLISASWSARVDRPSERSRLVEARVAPLRLDLARARSVAAPFLPKHLPLRDLEGTAALDALSLRLEGPDNDGLVTVENFALDLPRAGFGSLDGEGLALVLDKLSLPLKRLAPVGAALDLTLRGRRLGLSGQRPLLVRGMKGNLHLDLTDLELKEKRAVARGSQALAIELVQAGSELALEGVREELRFEGRAPGGGALDAAVPELKLSLAKAQAVKDGKKATLRDVVATASADGIRLPGPGQGKPGLRNASLALSAADGLELSARLGLPEGGRGPALCAGKARLDLGKLLAAASPFLPKGLSAQGLAALSWDVAAPLPVSPAPKEDNPLRAAKNAVGLLERAECSLDLGSLDLRVPAGAGAYRVEGLSTTAPVRVSLLRGKDALGMTGGVRFASLGGLPGSAAKVPLRDGALSFDGELSQWKELRLTEELRVASIGLNQVAELTVGRIDSLLDGDTKLDTATLLRRLDATMFAHLEGTFPREAKPVVAGVSISGNVAAGARVDLTAARELRLRGYTKCRDFGMKDGKGLSASGIDADLVLDRAYALAQEKGDGWTPLSALLMHPAPVAPQQRGNSDLAARIYDDLRGESSGPRKIGIRSVSIDSVPVPLEATDLEADLLLEPGSIGLSYLQAELGGGTVRARGLVDLEPETPVLSTYLNFSRLDPVLLFPAAGGARAGGEGELTGELSLTAPLAADNRAFLEGIRLNLNLRRFSSRILERALFAVDPYQRNEKIVAQRKSLRLADLKGLRVSAVDGALDCEGELLVKGVSVEMPRVDRLRLAELPLEKELARLVAAIGSSRAGWELLRADTLVVGPKGELSLKRRNSGD